MNLYDKYYIPKTRKEAIDYLCRIYPNDLEIKRWKKSKAIAVYMKVRDKNG